MRGTARRMDIAHVESWDKPAEQIGGDFIIRDETPDLVAIALGDATGHGRDAAQLARCVQPLIRREIRYPLSQDRLRQWHEFVYRNFAAENRFVCLTVMQLDLTTGSLAIVNAGNPDALIRRKAGQIIERFPSTGMPLGLLTPDEWRPPTIQRTTLGESDCSFCFSDGVVDGVGRGGERFGMRRIFATALAASTASLFHNLRRGLCRFLSPTVEQDDLSLLAISMRRVNVA